MSRCVSLKNISILWEDPDNQYLKLLFDDLLFDFDFYLYIDFYLDPCLDLYLDIYHRHNYFIENSKLFIRSGIS